MPFDGILGDPDGSLTDPDLVEVTGAGEPAHGHFGDVETRGDLGPVEELAHRFPRCGVGVVIFYGQVSARSPSEGITS